MNRFAAPRSMLPSRAAPVVVGLLLGVIAVLAVLAVQDHIEGDPPGANDFITFWSAYEVARAGGDAYDPASIGRVQDEVGLEAHPDGASLFFNPPWLLLAMAPVVALPWEAANAAWLVCNAALALACAWMGWRLWGPAGEPLPPVAFATALLFVPVVETLLIGQLGLLMAAVVLVTFLALRRRMSFVAGAGLALWTLKAQLFLPLAVVVALLVLWRREWRVVASAMATLVVALGSSLVLFPETTRAWRPWHGPTDFHTPTIGSWLRAWWFSESSPPAWPIVLVPVLGCLLVGLWAWSRRPQEDDPLILAVAVLSLLVAPHAFIYDAAVLVPIQVVVVGALALGERRARLPVLVLVVAQALLLGAHASDRWQHQHLIFGPVLFGLVWLGALPITRRRLSEARS